MMGRIPMRGSLQFLEFDFFTLEEADDTAACLFSTFNDRSSAYSYTCTGDVVPGPLGNGPPSGTIRVLPVKTSKISPPLMLSSSIHRIIPSATSLNGNHSVFSIHVFFSLDHSGLEKAPGASPTHRIPRLW